MVTGDFRGFFKVFSCLKSREAVLNRGNRSKRITLTVLVLLLTVSMVLALPETFTKTKATPQTPAKATMLEKGINAKNNDETKEWSKTYGGRSGDYGYYVEQTPDGGYIIVGSTASYGAGRGDFWLIKTDENGTVSWNQTYGGTEWDGGRCVQQTSDGGYIIVGSTESYGAGYSDVWLIKTNSTGGLEWNQTYGGSIDDHGQCVVQTSDGGYIITGFQGQILAATSTMSSRVVPSGGIWLIKTNSTGGLEWNKTYGEAYIDKGYCVVQTADGGYIIVGATIPFETYNHDVWLIKTDEKGDEVWNQTYGGTGWDEGYCVRQTADGGYIITGKKAPYGYFYSDVWLIKTDTNLERTNNIEETIPYIPHNVWLIKTDSNGNEEWSKTYGGTEQDVGYCVDNTTDGGYIITGRTESYGAGYWDVWLIKTDENGNKEWSKTYGGRWSEGSYCVRQTSDGGYIIVGSTESYGAGYSDVWLIKTYGGDSEQDAVIYVALGVSVGLVALLAIYLNHSRKLWHKELKE